MFSIKIAFLCALAVGYVQCFGKSPHIILIMADDVGWNDFSFHGQNQIPTPNVDALAYNGIAFKKFYTLPSGSASMSALLTGRYPMRMGMQGPSINPGEDRSLPSSVRILPQWLKQYGYKTHLVGKWNLGYARKVDTPLSKGFDSFFGIWNKFAGYFDYETQVPTVECSEASLKAQHDEEEYVEDFYHKPTTSKPPHTKPTTTERPTKPTNKPPFEHCSMHGFDLHDGMRPAWEHRGEYCTHLFTKKSIDIINHHNKNQPLFLFVSHLAGHNGKNNTEIEVPDRHENDNDFGYINDIGRRRYAGVVKEFDKSVGKIIKALEAKGLLHNSIVMVLSDNGAKPIGPNANKGSNWPFKGMKGTPHEGGVRGTAVIFSPLLKFKDNIFDHLFHITDVLPTLVAAAGGEATKSSFMDGISHWNCLKDGGKSVRHELLINIDEVENCSAIISHGGKFKFVKGSYHRGSLDGYHGDSGRSVDNPAYDIKKVLNCDTSKAIKKMQVFPNFLIKEKSNEIRNELDYFGKCNELKRYETPKACIPYCLFDLDNDPCETTDISHKHMDITLMLKEKIEKIGHGIVKQKKQLISKFANPNVCFSNWFPWKDWALYCNERPKSFQVRRVIY